MTARDLGPRSGRSAVVRTAGPRARRSASRMPRPTITATGKARTVQTARPLTTHSTPTSSAAGARGLTGDRLLRPMCPWSRFGLCLPSSPAVVEGGDPGRERAQRAGDELPGLLVRLRGEVDRIRHVVLPADP